MSKILRVLAVPATGAYYYIDLTALQHTPLPLAEQYKAESMTPGLRCVREVAEALSVGLVLKSSASSPSAPDAIRTVWGDCVTLPYSSAPGREPVFRTVDGLSTIRREVAPFLEGRHLASFRDLAAQVEALTERAKVPAPQQSAPDRSTDTPGERLSRRDLLATPLRFLRAPVDEAHPSEETTSEETLPQETVTVERALHPAIQYGVSQALLRAVAATRGQTMAEVIADEWNLHQPAKQIPIHAQGSTQRREDADKMIARRVDSLPHTLVEDHPNQLAGDGQALMRYARWLRARLETLGSPDYRPTIHLDVHGALGRMYDHNLGRILGYLYRLESCVQPYTLRVESPVIMDTRAAQVDTMRTLREYVQFRNMNLQIVADEWANTLDDIRAFVATQAADMIHIKTPHLGSVHNSIEALLACKKGDTATLLGGSSTETDLSARVTAHIALATQPDVVMAKPGMGVDEGITILQNEMARTLASIETRTTRSG